MVAVLKYSVLRIGLFVACLVVLRLLGAGGWLLLLLAAVVSLGLSYLLLGGPREEMAELLSERVDRRVGRGRPRDADAEAEDAEDDAHRNAGA